MVLLGTLGGAQGQLDLGLLMRKRLSLRGVTMRTRTLEEKLVVTRAFATEVLPLLASSKVKPIIERVYPLEEIRAAHTAMSEHQHFGKRILTIEATNIFPRCSERKHALIIKEEAVLLPKVRIRSALVQPQKRLLGSVITRKKPCLSQGKNQKMFSGVLQAKNTRCVLSRHLEEHEQQ